MKLILGNREYDHQHINDFAKRLWEEFQKAYIRQQAPYDLIAQGDFNGITLECNSKSTQKSLQEEYFAKIEESKTKELKIYLPPGIKDHLRKTGELSGDKRTVEEQVANIVTRTVKSEVFYISGKELEKLKAWEKEHSKSCPYAKPENQGAIGGGRTYLFTPNNLGTVITVHCACDSKIDLTNYAEW